MRFDPKFAERMGFKTFGDPELEKVMLACQEWVHAFENKLPARWLAFIGKSGTGKTRCTRQLFKWANDQVKTGRTVTKKGFNYHEDLAYFPHEIYWPDFVQKLKSGKAYEIRDDMKHWPILFLDDVGAERDLSGFAAEELNALLGCRMGKWTLVTSNCTIERLAEVDQRISSRLIRPPNVCVSVNTIDYAFRHP